MLVLVAPAQATFPGNNGKIAYSACGSTDCGIFVVNPDGTRATQITHSPFAVGDPDDPITVFDTDPNLSADGQKLVFVRRVMVDTRRLLLRSDIYSVNADGSGLAQLTTDGETPAWSPDGERIVFTRRSSRLAAGVLVMRADGTQVTPIADGDIVSPDWSPDGSTIAFSRRPPGGAFNLDIHLVNPDGSNERQITFSEPGSTFYNSEPSWSPDGQGIALTRADVGLGICCRHATDVWVMNADGSGLTNLTPNTLDRDDELPVWSPDGTKIAYRTKDGLVLVMNADGTARTPVAFALRSRLSWQPIPGPKRSDHKNAAKFCKAERDFLGDEAFIKKYGTNANGANAHGKCVSQNH